MIVAAAVLASGLGALGRYGVSGMVQRRTGGTRPWGTAVVNVSGALLLGLLVGAHTAGSAPDAVATVLGAGFLGGFTTFSTWMVESVRLGEEGGTAGLVALAMNTLVMLVAGVLGAALGTSIG